MSTFTAVGINDNLTSGQTGISVRTTDDKLSGRVNMIDNLVIEQSQHFIVMNRSNHARHQNLVAAGVADEMLVQVSYAIGVARPINIFVDTYGRSHVNMTDGEIARVIDQLFDLRPKAIEERLKLRNPIYQETAAYGHMGREPQVVTKKFSSRYEGDKTVEVELFTWEKLDYVDKIKAAFGL
mgnify:CR=1 FL=1